MSRSQDHTRKPAAPKTRRARIPLLAATLALAALPLAGCAEVLSRALPSGVIHPRITPSATDKGSLTKTHEFAFEDGKANLSVPIDRAVYVASEDAQKSAVFLGDEEPTDWVPDYYRAFIEEEHQEAFYESLLAGLHQIRDREGLDDSRYVELVTSMAQTLEYKTDPGSLAPKFPIETFGDGYGDCDDKTLLAAGLLARDGYDVAVLLFEPERHVALGIRAPGLDYKNTGYAYVEMTEPSLVGIPAEELATGESLESQPKVIEVGDGTNAYAAAEQTEYIRRRLDEIDAAAQKLKTQIAAQQAELESKKSQIDEAAAALKTIRDAQTLNDAVRRYNAEVNAYNALSAETNELVARYNALVDVQRFVAGHQTSRPQVYERVRAAKL